MVLLTDNFVFCCTGYESFGKRVQGSRGVLIEYDIMVSENIFQRLLKRPLSEIIGRSGGRGKRAATANTGGYWPNGVVHYAIKAGHFCK